MAKPSKNKYTAILLGFFFLALGAAFIGLGWKIPSRFNSIPIDVLAAAGNGTHTLPEETKAYLADGNVGVAELLYAALESTSLPIEQSLDEQLQGQLKANPVLRKWGTWDPFLDAAFSKLSLSDYASQPGALGMALSRQSRAALRDYLGYSLNPLVKDLLASGNLAQYRRLLPVYSASGQPLEATLLMLALLAQSDALAVSVKQELRRRIVDAQAAAGIQPLEDFYLDALSLGRLLNWGQFKSLAPHVEDLDTYARLRYAFHRLPEEMPSVYAACLWSGEPRQVMEYMKLYGEEGVETLKLALRYGLGALRLVLREQLPVDGAANGYNATHSFEQGLAAFSLGSPILSLALKYGLYFLGPFFCFVGLARLPRVTGRESVRPLLSFLQRAFASAASVLVLIVLSEPSLANGQSSEGFSFSFAVPVITEVAGETQIVATTPTTSMETTTLLSVSFFFLLQVLVFFICLLKVREIDRESVDGLVKLRLMENEENLFDTGLYVGIAGTCISLVLQVLGLIEANLIAAYSSNLFGILGVAIVKIRLVRPYKNRLILECEEQLVALSKKAAAKS